MTSRFLFSSGPRLASLALVLGGACLFAGCDGAAPSFGKTNLPKYRTAPVTRADIVRTVEATGTVTPRNSSAGIPVGAQVNGKLIRLFVDYNSIVTNGQVVALIDPLVYEATYKGAVAQLHVNEANVGVREAALASARADLVLAEKTYARKKTLVEKKLSAIADLDSALAARDRAQAAVDNAIASLESAKAAVEQSKATVDKAKADFDYCTIVSPVNGVVIDRKVEEGETVVSSMNAVPVLTIAEDLRTIWVEATVPEADVGNLKIGQDVTFTADAYRRKFKGRVKQIRRAATTTNNVVTFPVIIEAENPDDMLFPGMTATLSIETARAENAVAVTSAALRFRPKEADRAPGEIPRGRKIWFAGADGKLTPVSVEAGVSDGSFTQLCGASEALEGRPAVIGYETVRTQGGSEKAENPFMPKRMKHGTAGTAPAKAEAKK